MLADNATDIVIWVALDGEVLYASPSAKALGYSPDAMVGHEGISRDYRDPVRLLTASGRGHATSPSSPARPTPRSIGPNTCSRPAMAAASGWRPAPR